MDESQVNYSSVRKVGKRPAFHTAVYKAGTVVFHEGDASRDTFFVVSGALTAFRKLGGQVLEIAQYREGDSFGELGVLTEKPRPYGVRADVDCQLTVIPPLLLIAQLQQAPLWLSSAFQEFGRHIQDISENLNRTTSPDSLEALSLYLSNRCMGQKQKKEEYVVLSFFEVLDEFCLLSRSSHEQARKEIYRLSGLGIVVINHKHELIVGDPDLLEILYVVLNHGRNGKSLNLLFADPDIQTCLSIIPRIPAKATIPKQTLLDLWNANLRSGNSEGIFNQLVKLGAIVEASKQLVHIHKHRCEWLVKAQHEVPILLEKLKVK